MSAIEPPKLPPGQYALDHFPRFGLSQFARRFPAEIGKVELQTGGEGMAAVTVSEELRALPRVEQTADFHCVTTWTVRGLRWGGFRFGDFFHQIVVPRRHLLPEARYVIFRCQDGYATCLPLADLLAEDVLFADRLDGEPLTVEHGAPLRLVAPAHYGYKNAKHVSRVELWGDDGHHRPAAFRFMDHPRARVALEERGRGVPGWFLRYLYRPLVRPTIRQFRRALAAHRLGR